MKIAVLARLGVRHQIENADAMTQGLARHGIAAELTHPRDAVSADVVVCWGWRIGSHYRAQGHDVLVMERGHVGVRRAHTSCGWNGLGRRGRYVRATDNGRRWDALWGALERPWRDGGGYALVLGQCSGDAAVDGIPGGLEEWASGVSMALTILGHDVVFRPHPLAGARFCPPDARLSTGTLADDLAGASLAVAWNSTATVESVLAGVPTVTLDEGAMAWPVASHDIGAELRRPDRSEWCADLAWAQFSMDEIASGFAWDHLKEIRCA